MNVLLIGTVGGNVGRLQHQLHEQGINLSVANESGTAAPLNVDVYLSHTHGYWAHESTRVAYGDKFRSIPCYEKDVQFKLLRRSGITIPASYAWHRGEGISANDWPAICSAMPEGTDTFVFKPGPHARGAGVVKISKEELYTFVGDWMVRDRMIHMPTNSTHTGLVVQECLDFKSEYRLYMSRGDNSMIAVGYRRKVGDLDSNDWMHQGHVPGSNFTYQVTQDGDTSKGCIPNPKYLNYLMSYFLNDLNLPFVSVDIGVTKEGAVHTPYVIEFSTEFEYVHLTVEQRESLNVVMVESIINVIQAGA